MFKQIGRGKNDDISFSLSFINFSVSFSIILDVTANGAITNEEMTPFSLFQIKWINGFKIKAKRIITS